MPFLFIVYKNHALDAWFGKNYIVEPYTADVF